MFSWFVISYIWLYSHVGVLSIAGGLSSVNLYMLRLVHTTHVEKGDISLYCINHTLHDARFCEYFIHVSTASHEKKVIYTKYLASPVAVLTLILILKMYTFQWRENAFFVKFPQTISRTTAPNIGLFVLILMLSPCWYQIWAQNISVLKFLKIF